MTDIEKIELALYRAIARLPANASGGLALEVLLNELSKIGKPDYPAKKS